MQYPLFLGVVGSVNLRAIKNDVAQICHNLIFVSEHPLLARSGHSLFFLIQN